jgi:hypothetical protein
MNNAQKWVVIGGLFIVGLVGGLFAQQQFSGGQTVTIGGSLPSGSNAIGSVTATQATGSNLHVAVDSAPSTAVTGTFWQATQPTSLASLPALAAGTNKVGIVYPLTGCGTTNYESGAPAGFAALAASTTTLTSTTTCLLTLIITNTGSASFTYYVTDGQATPVSILGSSGNPITILPGERDEYTFSNGAKANSGVKLTASATTGAYYALGVQ